MIKTIAGALTLACMAASAAVPLKWQVETSRLRAASFDAVRGETLALEAEVASYGAPVDLTGRAVAIYWQTNGMGSAWWTAPATGGAGRVSAAFTPAMDPGAPAVNGYIGVAGEIYRAAFTLRFRPGPGAVPNALAPPVQTIDFATVEVTNAPWVTAGEVAAATNAVLEAARAGGPFVPVEGADGSMIEHWTTPAGAVVRLAPAMTSHLGWFDILEIAADYETGPLAGIRGSPYPGYPCVTARDEVAGMIAGKADAGTVTELAKTVNAWKTYWDGDDVRVTITNYFGALDLPSLYIEQRMEPDDDHAEAWFRTVWDERTRWGDFLAGYATVTNHVEQDLADRAWGVYDSATGAYSPDGLLQLSQGQIMIGGGMSWQKTATEGGGVWVLTATEPTAITGVASNGFLRIEDGDGNAIWEVVKGDKRVVGANATAAEMAGGKFVITYGAVSDRAPEMEWCPDLNEKDWQPVQVTADYTGTGGAIMPVAPRPGAPFVEWYGSSGAWTGRVAFAESQPSAAFFRASYEAGGNTYIRNHVAQTIDKVVVGGVEYSVKVETLTDGRKVMVLE